MALKVELKPGERFILGESVITNDKQRTRLYVEGNAPILREKDIIRPEDADTPCKKIYLIVQMMYLSANARDHHELYFELVRDLIAASEAQQTETFFAGLTAFAENLSADQRDAISEVVAEINLMYVDNERRFDQLNNRIDALVAGQVTPPIGQQEPEH